jgi:hypothetical protein
MPLRSRRSAMFGVALVIPLVLGLAASTPASAGSAAASSPGRNAAQTSPPRDDEDLNSWLRRTLFPDLPSHKCLTGDVVRPSGWSAPVPCEPQVKLKDNAADVPPEFQNQSGTEFAILVAARAGVPLRTASTQLAAAAGIAVGTLDTLTVGQVGQKIYNRVGRAGAGSDSTATGSTTKAFNTRVCVTNPQGNRQCRALDPEYDGLIIGTVVGSAIGGTICGPVCGFIGAIVGAIIGALSD